MNSEFSLKRVMALTGVLLLVAGLAFFGYGFLNNFLGDPDINGAVSLPPVPQKMESEPARELNNEKTPALFIYSQRRSIPANPFAPFDRPEPQLAEETEEVSPPKEEMGQVPVELEIDKGEEVKVEVEIEAETSEVEAEQEEAVQEEVVEEAPPPPPPSFAVRGILGSADYRLALLEIERESIIVAVGDVVRDWTVVEINSMTILIQHQQEHVKYELSLGGE